VEKSLEGRSANLSLGYGPISFDGFLDDETPISITYFHEEVEPAIEIKVSKDKKCMLSSSSTESDVLVWSKILPHADGHDMSYIYPPSEILKLVENETGLEVKLDPNTPLEIPPPDFMRDTRHSGLLYAFRMRRAYQAIRAERVKKDLAYKLPKEN